VNLNVIQQPKLPPGAAPAGSSPAPSGSPAAGASSTASPSAGADGAPGTPEGLPTDPIWDHNKNTWLKDMGLLIGLGLVFTGLAWWRLVKIKPGRRR
jgi:hypothetical protein